MKQNAYLEGNVDVSEILIKKKNARRNKLVMRKKNAHKIKLVMKHKCKWNQFSDKEKVSKNELTIKRKRQEKSKKK